MKLPILFVACLMAVNAPFALAQQQPPSTGQSVGSDSAPQPTRHLPTPEEAVARMNAKLNLTDDQKNKITPIIADRQEKMRALMADTSGRKMRKARKAKSILSDSDKKIEAVLTSDQRKIYEQMKEEAREEMRARRQQSEGNPQQ
jgi:Spy/CpxP family protein refolding chaperone